MQVSTAVVCAIVTDLILVIAHVYLQDLGHQYIPVLLILYLLIVVKCPQPTFMVNKILIV